MTAFGRVAQAPDHEEVVSGILDLQAYLRGERPSFVRIPEDDASLAAAEARLTALQERLARLEERLSEVVPESLDHTVVSLQHTVGERLRDA